MTEREIHMTILVSQKNYLLMLKADNTVQKERIADLDNLDKFNITGPITFKVNKQWMSEKNRAKIEELAATHTIENNTLYPETDLIKHFEMTVNFVSKKKVALEMSETDINALNTLLDKYNKTTLNKYIRKG